MDPQGPYQLWLRTTALMFFEIVVFYFFLDNTRLGATKNRKSSSSKRVNENKNKETIKNLIKSFKAQIYKLELNNRFFSHKQTLRRSNIPKLSCC